MAVAEMIVMAALALAAMGTVTVVVSVAQYIYNHLIFRSQPATIEHQHNKEYTLHETDKKYIHASREVLHEVLGEAPVGYLMTLEPEERISVIQSLTQRLSEIYGLEDIQIELGYSDDLNICGCYIRMDHKIVLNCAHLLTTNTDLTKEFLDTIFHEFRHAVQWKMTESVDYIWYNDEKTVREIAYGFSPEHYISYHENPRAYYNQYVEVDAREIAMYILEG